MADLEDQLSRELTRIISCSYPASLAKLADILAIASADSVQKCAGDRPECDISNLASIVAAAVPLWPYSLQIVQNLCHSRAFRNSLLLQHPGILNTLLTRANSSQREFDKYAGTCVLLLSRHLPDAVQLPEAALGFFLSIFENAVRKPSVQTLRPIYSMLNGACQGLLSILSTDDQHRFDKELCQILSSHSTGQDSMLLLWCIGIVLLVEESQHTAGASNKFSGGSNVQMPTPVHQRQWSTASGRKLFGSPKWLLKTINLTYLSVIWATKGDGVSDAEAVEGIAIGTRVLKLVDRETREQWPTSNDLARGSFPKLPLKILRDGISATVQLEAMCFYAMIVGESCIPANIANRYEEILLEIPILNLEVDKLQEALHVSLQLFAPHLRETTLQSLLLRLLDTGAVTRSPQASSNLIALTKELISTVPSCVALQRRLPLALSTREMQQSLQAFLASPTHFELIPQRPLHNTITAAESRNIVANILTMLLTVALTAADATRALPQQVMSCAYKHLTHMDECTPATGFSTTNWRDKLKSEIDLQSSYQRDSLSRCENALDGQMTQLHSQITALQSEIVDQKLIDNEKENLLERLRDLTMEFDGANKRAEETLRAAQDQFHAKELELRSHVISHEESLLARGRELKKSQDELVLLKNEIRQMESNYAELFGNNDNLKAKLSNHERELESERRNGAHRAEELEQLRGNVADLESRLSSTASKFQNTKRELIESSAEALQDLEAKYETSMEAAATKAAEEHDHLSEELRNALEGQQQAKSAYENTGRELQLGQKAVGALEAKKDAELDELRSIKHNILASMGLSNVGALPMRIGPPVHEEVNDPRTPGKQHHRRRKSTLPKEDLDLRNMAGTQANASFTSSDSSRNGPTPKRAKPRPTFKIPAMHTPYGQKAATTSRTHARRSSPSKRSALKAMSPNRRHTTVGFAISDNEDSDENGDFGKRRGSFDAAEQASFDMEGLAGTPFTPGDIAFETGREPNGDEGTTEL
ncbi:hypothetical protein BDV96DRAFT_615909 [Lophiotrema nucula]|uniref:Uncharacterized protein n=1 Tax=Lophiotrema nucula TaxID=690887 RepID=A0A6A5YSV6_9PLEO|nr:hypothetical protein BDV96DRAFT_615909 [Lophiotrema nucula]